MKVLTIPTRSDNYSYLLLFKEKAGSGTVDAAVVDPGESAAIEQALEQHNLSLRWILLTHGHADHIDGVPELLKNHPDVQVFCGEIDARSLDFPCTPVSEGPEWNLLPEPFQVFHTPCHTRGHVLFFFPHEKALFTGDTLFVAGCGRFFEGTAEDMHGNFQKILSLPDETKIFCGHEYSCRGLEFGLSIEPGNEAIQKRLDRLKKSLADGAFSVPSSIAEERETNVFLRASSLEVQATIQEHFGELKPDLIWILARIRELKDQR